jgi:hypothetical protein
VKPHRVKLVDPQSPRGEFSPAGGRAWRPRFVSELAVALRLAGRVHFPRLAESHDRFGGGQEPGGEVAARSNPCRTYSPPRWTRRWTEDAAAATRRGSSGRVRLWPRCSQRVETACLVRIRARGSLRVSGESVGNPPDPS